MQQLKKPVSMVPRYAVLALWTGFMMFSILWLAVASLKGQGELFRDLWALPESPQWDNYARAWTRGHMGRAFVNSVVVSGLSLTGLVIVCSPCAYVLSQFKFRGSVFLINFLTLGMAIPGQLLLIPLFVQMNDIRATDTIWGLAFTYGVLAIPFTVFVLTGFFRSLPSELAMAARVDGCSELGVFWRIMMPLAAPGVITVVIFNFTWTWNEYMWALIMITDVSKRTMALGLYNLIVSTQWNQDYPALFASVVILLIPSLAAFSLFSRRMISGITIGAMKGGA